MSVRRISDARVIAAAFHQGPTFRMGFDQHVRAWRRVTDGQAWARYHRNPAFRAAYEARRAEVV